MDSHYSAPPPRILLGTMQSSPKQLSPSQHEAVSELARQHAQDDFGTFEAELVLLCRRAHLNKRDAIRHDSRWVYKKLSEFQLGSGAVEDVGAQTV